MSDYIKREDAIDTIKPIIGWWVDDEHFVVSLETVLSIIHHLPSADVVERSVMESYAGYAYDCGYEKGLEDCQNCEHRRKKGEWIDKVTYAICSECGSSSGTQFDGVEPIAYKSPFCPNCGARMKGADDEKRLQDNERLGRGS